MAISRQWNGRIRVQRLQLLSRDSTRIAQINTAFLSSRDCLSVPSEAIGSLHGRFVTQQVSRLTIHIDRLLNLAGAQHQVHSSTHWLQLS